MNYKNHQRWHMFFAILVIAAMALLFAAGASAAEREPVEGEFQYVLAGDGAWVTGYYGHPRGKLTIPKKLDGYPVTGIDSPGLSMFAITSVTIPDSVTYIGDGAFAWCESLTSVTIPAGVEEIEGNPFVGCPLKSIKVAKKNAVYTQIDGVLFDKAQNMLVSFPGGKKGEYAIPEGTLLIGDSAFAGCKGLTGVTIPESVTGIGNEVFDGCGQIVLHVAKGSYAEQYANDEDMLYTYGTEDAEAADGLEDTNKMYTSGQWLYIRKDGGAVIRGYAKEPRGELAIPGELDGYAVTGIGVEAFQGCAGLSKVTIPDGVTSIGDRVFRNCTGLTAITIPNSVTSIGSGAFSGCYGLTEVIIPGKVQAIEENTFFQCTNLTAFTIPDSVTRIGNSAFFDCPGLTAIDLPDGVTDIGNSAFWGCKGLTDIIIPDSVTSISAMAFSYCDGLTSVTIPDSVTSIGNKAFAYCYRLTLSVTTGSVAEQYAKDNDIRYTGGMEVAEDPKDAMKEEDTGTLTDASGQWKYAVLDGGAVIIGNVNEPSGDLVIPVKLDGYTVVGIGDRAFYSQRDLTGITIPDGVAIIGDGAFYWCTGLTSITIPGSAKTIGAEAFKYCLGLTAVTIGNGVAGIGAEAFFGCDKLADMTIPDSVAQIGDKAFVWNKRDELVFTVTEGSYAEQYAKDHSIKYRIGTVVMGITDASKKWTYSLADGQATLTGYLDKSKKTALPAELDGYPVVGIGDSAFEGNMLWTGVTIPANIHTIGDAAFRGCAKLKSVKITNGIAQIGDAAFSGCAALATVIIPGSAGRIGSYAFAECKGLTGAEIKSGVAEIGPGAFMNCAKLSKLSIPASITAIGESAFSGCSQLKKIAIPAGVTDIGDGAFDGCKKVTLSVVVGSYAEQYAKDKGIAYVHIK